jgi:hypothetical protein
VQIIGYNEGEKGLCSLSAGKMVIPAYPFDQKDGENTPVATHRLFSCQICQVGHILTSHIDLHNSGSIVNMMIPPKYGQAIYTSITYLIAGE